MAFLDDGGVTKLAEELRDRLSDSSRVFTGTGAGAASATIQTITLDNPDGFLLKQGVVLLATFENGVDKLLTVDICGRRYTVTASSNVDARINPYETAVLSFDGTRWYLSPTINMVTNAAVQTKGVMWQYGTCSTASTTYDKVVSDLGCPKTFKGMIITVAFTYASTYAGRLRLKVMNLTNRNIYVNGASTSATNTLTWNAGELLTFYYDGSNWNYLYRGVVPPLTPSS